MARALVRAVSRLFSTQRTRSLEPVERLTLTQQHSIHLVRIHGRELLVATHPQGCTLLHDETLGGSA